MKLSDIMESVLEGFPKSKQTCELVSYILEKHNALTADKTLQTKEILDAYHDMVGRHPNIVYIPDNTIAIYLSLLAANEEYPICCPGKKQGYFLKKEQSDTSMPLNQDELSRCNIQEKNIYPILASWLTTEGYEKVQDISLKRGMGPWGNPDLIGLRILDLFKRTFLEITTVEVKRDCQNWRKDIFEAVAHTMFANRSYYAYLCRESDKVDKRMVLYAQKFNIGILAIIVPDDQWGQELKPDEIEIREIFPAPEQKPCTQIQKEFLLSLGIYDYNSYQQFACQESK